MPMKVTAHVQTAGHRLHMPFEHGTDPMTTGMKESLQEFGAFLLKAVDRFECFSLEVLTSKDQKLSKMGVVAALRFGMIDAPDEELQARVDGVMLAAVTNA